MSFKVTKKSVVKPAEETPRQSLWLSSLDLVIHDPKGRTSSVFYYPRRPQNDGSSFFNTDTLKESLSRALVPFYPLAGRLRVVVPNNNNLVENNKQQQQQRRQRLEIDCNGEGALFIEAETTQYSLSDFAEDNFLPNDRLLEVVLPPLCDYDTEELSSLPLLMVQLTRFNCGGVALGFSNHHAPGDGAAYLHFVVSWSRLARGIGLAIPPVLDRIPRCLHPRSPPQVRFQHFEYHSMPLLLPGGPQLDDMAATATTTVSMFKISKDQINALKQKATSSEEEGKVMNNYKLSTFEALAGQVWRSACIARGLAHDQEVKLTIPVDGRSRLALPQGYFGNAIFHAACVAKAGDVMRKPLWYAASEIHKALTRMKDEEYLRSAIDYLESLADIIAIARGPHTCRSPNLIINSWARLPFYEADFGWGEPVFAGNGRIMEGLFFILQSPHGDGSLYVTTKLFTHQMALFHNSLYDFE